MDKQSEGILSIDLKGDWVKGDTSKSHYEFRYDPSSPPEQCFVEAFQKLTEIAQKVGVRDVSSILQQVESRPSASQL